MIESKSELLRFSGVSIAIFIKYGTHSTSAVLTGIDKQTLAMVVMSGNIVLIMSFLLSLLTAISR